MRARPVRWSDTGVAVIRLQPGELDDLLGGGRGSLIGYCLLIAWTAIEKVFDGRHCGDSHAFEGFRSGINILHNLHAKGFSFFVQLKGVVKKFCSVHGRHDVDSSFSELTGLKSPKPEREARGHLIERFTRRVCVAFGVNDSDDSCESRDFIFQIGRAHV